MTSHKAITRSVSYDYREDCVILTLDLRGTVTTHVFADIDSARDFAGQYVRPAKARKRPAPKSRAVRPAKRYVSSFA